MILQQAIMTHAPSPDTPSRLPAHAAATVTDTDIVGLQPQPVKWPWQHRLVKQGPSPRSLVANRCRHQSTRVTYHAYHAYHAPFPSTGSFGV